jgi:hypothetical protein
MLLAFIHFYAMWLMAGILTRLIVSKWPDAFLSQALIYAQ